MPAPEPFGILAVVVVYGRAGDAAAPMPLLRRWLAGEFEAAGAPPLRRLLVWDNSPEPAAPLPAGQPGIEAVADPSNGGTRAGYSAAAERAASIGASWVLLFDQDTLPPTGFPAAVGAALAGPVAPSAAALVPRMRHEGALVSPAIITGGGRVVPRPLSDASPTDRSTLPTAIASGTLIRTEDLRALLPIPREFWLDYLDHWLFVQLHRRGRAVGAIDCDIEHRLSISDPATMSEHRFRNILRAERRFVADLPGRPMLGYRLRLLLRALRLARRAPGLSRFALRAALGKGD